MKNIARLLAMILVCVFSVINTQAAPRIVGTAVDNTPPPGVCLGTLSLTLKRGQTVGTTSDAGGIYTYIAPSEFVDETTTSGMLYVGKLVVQVPSTNNRFELYRYDADRIASGPITTTVIDSANNNQDNTGTLGIGGTLGSHYNPFTSNMVHVGSNTNNAPAGCNVATCYHVRTYVNGTGPGLDVLDSIGGSGYTGRIDTQVDTTYTYLPMMFGVTEGVSRLNTNTYVREQTAGLGTTPTAYSGWAQDSTFLYLTASTNLVQRFLKSNLGSRTLFTTTFAALIALSGVIYDSTFDRLLILVVNGGATNNEIRAVRASNPASAPVASYTGFASQLEPYSIYIDNINNKVYVVGKNTSNNRMFVSRHNRETLAIEQTYTSTATAPNTVANSFTASLDVTHQFIYVPFFSGTGTAADYFEQIDLCS